MLIRLFKTSLARQMILLAVAIILALPISVSALEIEPFRSSNRNPLTQIYGLPSETTSKLTSPGELKLGISQDIASIYSKNENSNESILLDGELYRWNLTARYGLTDRLELGLELPVIIQGGGFLDGFIEDWHKFFGLAQGGRDKAPRNRLRYQYTKNGQTKLDKGHSTGGIGDISLLAAYKLYDNKTDTDHDTIALRTQLTLPSGDSKNLLGSGGTDLSLFLSGAMNRNTSYGTLGVYAAAGGLFASDGDILKDQRKNFVAFGNAGLGWAPTDWIAFKVQTDFNTAFYKGSSLDELGKTSVMMTFGGTLKLPGNYLLDIGVAEDVAVHTAPDVTFHLGLTKSF